MEDDLQQGRGDSMGYQVFILMEKFSWNFV